MKPSIDAIQEFKISTNAYTAESGTRVGWHCERFNEIRARTISTARGSEFMRNEKLDARNFFDDPDADKPPFKRNQFGGAIGGPIVKNKTFFFGDYEGTLHPRVGHVQRNDSDAGPARW